MSLGVYSDDEREAIRAAIAHVIPTSLIDDAEHLLYEVECRAGGAKYAIAYMDNRSPSEQASDLETAADRLFTAAHTMESLESTLQVLAQNGETDRNQTVSNLTECARLLKEHSIAVRTHKHRKGRNNKAHPFLQQLLGLWVAAGQNIGRYNKTAEFLEAASKPIYPDEIVENTVDSFIRNALKEQRKYEGMKPKEFSSADNLG